ncbi:ADP-ribosylglycohydrolase family protein [Nakamurella panacisegetis]|nr:ADP-ribosylglycohydrolase family protein [Nakamurella panacisegetis]
MSDTTDRALGALTGLAVGDALGMPTQSLPRELIVRRYGDIVGGFHAAPPDHPLAAGLKAGSITDDTEQALLLARLLIENNGRIDPAELGRRLLSWENDMRARGSLDLLGPSTRSAISNLLAGQDPTETGRNGTTNGAAMRITPVGITVDVSDLGRLVQRVVAASSFSHNTGVALAGAAAVAAAVSAGIDGATVAEAVELAVAAARMARHRGYWVAGGDVAARIEWAIEFVRDSDPAQLIQRIDQVVGTSLASQESVPAAFAVFAVHADNPWLACRIAASVGGDTDTIAAMVGAMSGAVYGSTAFPGAAVHLVTTVNHLLLTPMATALLALR